ncbi:hypothetical protein LTR53_019784, partial [Teratosphaeriaceae sp. CCFEE 6253]
WVDDGLADHARDAASGELRGLGDVARVVVPLEVGDGAFAGLENTIPDVSLASGMALG